MIRSYGKTFQVVVDLAVLAAAFALAFLARFEGSIPALFVRRMVLTLPYVVCLEYTLLFVFGVNRLAWRYISLLDVTRIARAMGVATLALLASRAVAAAVSAPATFAGNVVVPIGVILINVAFAFIGITSVRALRRISSERSENVQRSGTTPRVPATPTLLIGAGRAGFSVAREIANRADLGIEAVGFVDDDASKVGTLVHGVPVLGVMSDLEDISRRHGVKAALITMAAASGKEIRRIVGLCESARISTKIIPGLHEIVGGRVNLSRIRNVAIEDLLRREPINLDEAAIEAVVRGRVVVVTGAGGSIGSELCRQVCRFQPMALMLIERSENSLFTIERELREKFPKLTIVPAIADVGDAERIDDLFTNHKPHVVFHAAAHKHVPMMECNPGEAIKNNVFGTRVLADLADAHGVGDFVMISTDKAVNPTSVMGVSKRAAEIYIQALSQRSQTKFVAVRFGNVLGSAGSVVPIFQEQIARGGPVTVTHPEMTRYFMTIPEACQLVLQAAAMGCGGEIFVLDMGEPVKVVDLAKDIISLSGLRPGEDIDIIFTGIRPGEKLFEELSGLDEQADRTRHPKIFVGRIRPHGWESVQRGLEHLARAARDGDGELIRASFFSLVPEYTGSSLARIVIPARVESDGAVSGATMHMPATQAP